MSTLIELKNVGVRTDQRQILHGIDLSIQSDQIVTVIGPNGAGKTTLLKVVAGLVTPSEGTVKKSHKLRSSYLPQDFVLPQAIPMTVQDFLVSHGRVSEQSVEQAIGSVGLKVDMQQSAHVLSGGEMQKLLLARAVLSEPQLLILDEPAQGFDRAVQAAFYRTLQELRDSLSCSILLVSHDLNFVMSATDHVVCLNAHICCEGEPDDISRAPEYLALFGEEGLSDEFAVYHHSHDHEHGDDGAIIRK